MDLLAAKAIHIPPRATDVVSTGLSVAVPEGYELQVRSRGGLASRGIFVTNGPGTVDSDYRGEIMVILTNDTDDFFFVNYGDRIAQAVIAPVTLGEWVEVDELSSTERGEGRFSSTGISM